METIGGSERRGTMEDNAMRTATETQEDDNRVAVDMRYNGDGIQCLRWIWAVDYCGVIDVGQWGQRRYRYGKMDTAVEETWYVR